MSFVSRGKWLPGAKNTKSSNFSCEVCDRTFSSSHSLEKHLNTQLHFKRSSSLSSSGAAGRIHGTYAQDPDFFEHVPPSRIRSQRVCKASSSDPKTINMREIIYCPTCFANVDRRQMGKHLISHFHCQRTSKKDRLSNPEKNLILEHIRDIVVQSPFQCGNCNFYFTQKNQLLNHFETHHTILKVPESSKGSASYGWSCSACIQTCVFDVKSMIQHLNSETHLKMEVAIAKSIPIIIRQLLLKSCTMCDKRFKLNRQLMSHVKNEHQRQLASQADRKFNDDDEDSKYLIDSPVLDTQVNRFQGPTKTTLQSTTNALHVCPKCSAIFSSENSLNRHISHSHPTGICYKCAHCSYTNKKRSHYVRHLKTHDQTREKIYKCDTCDSAFHEKFALTFHMKIHTGKSFQCNFPGCNFLGRSKADVKDHSVTHESVCSHRCEQCSFSTKSKKHLRRHIKLLHSLKTITYACRYCSFKAKLKDGLKRHEQKHINELKFCCPYCDYKTHDLEFIRSHIIKRNQHPGKLLYFCRLCLLQNLTAFETNAFQHFQNHVTQEHGQHILSHSRRGLFIIAGLQEQRDDEDISDNNLPEFLKQVPSKEKRVARSRSTDTQKNIGKSPIHKTSTKYNPTVAVEMSEEVMQCPADEKLTVPIPIPGDSSEQTKNGISEVDELHSDYADDTVITNPYDDPAITLASPFVVSEIGLDVEGSYVLEAIQPSKEKSYCDLSNALPLLHSVEELDDVMELC